MNNQTKTSVTSSPTWTEEKKDSFSPDTSDQRLMQLAFQNDINSIKLLLNDRSYNLFDIKDKRDYTLLHVSCLNNQNELFSLIFGYIESTNQEQNSDTLNKLIEKWINLKTDEGFTPIHFASFRGNLNMIKKLEEHGADIYTSNNQGLNVLHIASQGDQPISLAYFKDKPNMDLNSLDKKGSTPLHWASYLGCENSVNFLTTWGGKINLADEEGKLTPLHLAVISGNSRVVRKLLIKGSDRNLRDKQNKTPLDLAKENEYNNITGLLEDRGLATFYNIKPAFRPNRKKKRSLFLFFMIFIGNSALLYIFCSPYIDNIIFLIINASLFVISLLFFSLAWLCNPGYIEKKTKYTLLDLLKENDCSNVCLDCEIVRPPRSKHCEICHKCVSVYDHHCPWINNCVGSKNHRYFLFFVFFVWLYIISLFVTAGYYIKNNDVINKFMLNLNIDKHILFIVKIAISGFEIIIGLTFWVPLTILLWIQLNNFFLNKTTSERFGFNVKNNNNRSFSTETNPSFFGDNSKNDKKQQKSKCKNFITMCWINSQNRAYSYTSLKNNV